jgi:hypothetical protein
MLLFIQRRRDYGVNTPTKLREHDDDASTMVNTDFEPTEEEEAILDVFKHDRGTVNPMYLREATDLGKGSINTALTRLTSAGWVRKVTRGLYEFVEDPRESAEDGRTRGSTVEETTPEPVEPTEPPDRPESVAVDRDLLREELAGSGEVLERRVDQIVAMYEQLQELGTAEKDDLLEAVAVDATEYASKDSVWSNMVKGRDTLKALPGVEPPPTGRTEWKYKP